MPVPHFFELYDYKDGKDPEALTNLYDSTPSEVRAALHEQLGELLASHLGGDDSAAEAGFGWEGPMKGLRAGGERPLPCLTTCPCLTTAPHAPAWWLQGLRPLRRASEHSLSIPGRALGCSPWAPFARLSSLPRLRMRPIPLRQVQTARRVQ